MQLRIVWDEPKRQANLAKHGLDFAELSIEFFLSARIEPARQGRMVAVGNLGGRIAVVAVFRSWGPRRFPWISLRPASARERSTIDD